MTCWSLTRRCNEPRPAPMRNLRVISSSSVQPHAPSGAVADLVSRLGNRKLHVNMPTVGEEQKKPPILGLGDVRLRPLRTSDAPALLAYLSDPRVIEHTIIPIATPESIAAVVGRRMAAVR